MFGASLLGRCRFSLNFVGVSRTCRCTCRFRHLRETPFSDGAGPVGQDPPGRGIRLVDDAAACASDTPHGLIAGHRHVDVHRVAQRLGRGRVPASRRWNCARADLPRRRHPSARIRGPPARSLYRWRRAPRLQRTAPPTHAIGPRWRRVALSWSTPPEPAGRAAPRASTSLVNRTVSVSRAIVIAASSAPSSGRSAYSNGASFRDAASVDYVALRVLACG